MDGLSRLARLSVRRPEVVKRNVEINTVHRNLNDKECWRCVAVCGNGKRVVLRLDTCEPRFKGAVKHSRMQAVFIERMKGPSGYRPHKDTVSSSNNCVAKPIEILLLRVFQMSQFPYRSIKNIYKAQINNSLKGLNGLLWLNFDDTCGRLACNQ